MTTGWALGAEIGQQGTLFVHETVCAVWHIPRRVVFDAVWNNRERTIAVILGPAAPFLRTPHVTSSRPSVEE